MAIQLQTPETLIVPKGAAFDAGKAARVEAFMLRHLRHMKGAWAGQPFALEPWQRTDIIAPLFGLVQPDGRRFYREAYVGIPRKNGKSEISAAIALYLLIADGEFGAEVFSVAGSRQQASIVFKTAADMVRASPLLRAACKVYRSVIEIPETGSIYRALSTDWSGGLLQGLNVHGAIIDEMHVHRTSDVYEAMRTATAARKQPLIVSITTAGAERHGIGWDLYQRGRGKQDPRFFFYWRGVDEGANLDDPKVWQKANPASWVTPEFLADQRRSLPAPVFARMHLNVWVDEDADMQVFPLDKWDACGEEPVFDPARPCVIAVDAASRRDTTAVALVQTDGDRMFNAKVWTFAADEELGFLDYGIVEDFIRNICSEYAVTRLAFDPFQMTRTQQLLSAEGLPAETFPQNDARMVVASQGLYDLVAEEKLRHGGDENLRMEMLNAGIRETARGWRLEKRKSNGHIDGIVALAMACQLAQWELELGEARVIVI